MSYSATNWAFQQKGLRPAQKVVLLYLADRHNPDYGCFPSQHRLALDCEMSRASLNTQLRQLEERNLIRRIRSRDRHSGQHVRTRYILGFEDGFDQTPSPETGHGPCPEYAQNRVQKLDTNLVIEPVRMMKTKQAPEFHISLLKVLGADPETGKVKGEGFVLGTAADMAEADRWIGDLGLGEEECLNIVRDVVRRAPKTPRSFRYFRDAMRAFASQKLEAPLTPKVGWQPKPVPTFRAELPEKYRKGESRNAKS